MVYLYENDHKMVMYLRMIAPFCQQLDLCWSVGPGVLSQGSKHLKVIINKFFKLIVQLLMLLCY